MGAPYEIIRVRRQGSAFKARLSVVKRLLRLPPALLQWKPINWFSKAYDKRFGKIEESAATLSVDVAGRAVVIVDDCIDTGSSIAYVREKLLAAGATRVSVAVICWSNKNDTAALHGVEPEVYLHRKIHYYPWSNNSPHYDAFKAWLKDAGHELWK
jgi:phosphoribosylpyrophosphate synthetase